MFKSRAMSVIGRFAVRADALGFQPGCDATLLVRNVIRQMEPAVSAFLENAPPGTLRVLGPMKRRKGDFLIVASPFPPLFRFLLITLPKFTRTKVSSSDPYTEIVNLNELFTPQKLFHVFTKSYLHLHDEARRCYQFTGLTIKPRYVPLEFSRKNGRHYYKILTLDPDTSALLRFLRYSGVGNTPDELAEDVEIIVENPSI